MIKLDRELAEIAVDGRRMLCGGGARLPAVAARAARAGLSGIEFGVNIPGTVGGAVRMNANAYGGELEGVLEWVRDRFGRRPASAAPRSSSASATGAPASSMGRSWRGRVCCCNRRRPRRSRRPSPSCAGRRHEAQPQGIRTFGSTFKNPEDPRAQGRTAGLLLAEAGCNGLAVGGARFAPKHANFIENTGDAKTADVLAVMAEGRRRVLERFGIELEPEVQTLGEVRFPWQR